MVDVSSFAGFVPKTAFLQILAVEKDVFLQVLLMIEKMVVVGRFALVVIVDDAEDAANPMGIA